MRIGPVEDFAAHASQAFRILTIAASQRGDKAGEQHQKDSSPVHNSPFCSVPIVATPGNDVLCKLTGLRKAAPAMAVLQAWLVGTWG